MNSPIPHMDAERPMALTITPEAEAQEKARLFDSMLTARARLHDAFNIPHAEHDWAQWLIDRYASSSPPPAPDLAQQRVLSLAQQIADADRPQLATLIYQLKIAVSDYEHQLPDARKMVPAPELPETVRTMVELARNMNGQGWDHAMRYLADALTEAQRNAFAYKTARDLEQARANRNADRINELESQLSTAVRDREEEREACIKVVEDFSNEDHRPTDQQVAALHIIDLLRARTTSPTLPSGDQ